jgi:dsDNA-specific endonuclease/ATPase MutS2
MTASDGRRGGGGASSGAIGGEPPEDESETWDERDFEREPATVPIEDALDLHTFRPQEIPSVVEEYLEAAAAAGFVEVRLIHGRGIGAQREAVRHICEKHPRVESFSDATPDRGGWGATVVRLKRG